MHNYSPMDFLYASARIRALEAKLIGRERLLALCSGTEDDVLSALAEAAGVSPAARGGELDPEDALLTVLKEGVAMVSASVPNPAITHFVEYPYDCHNIKVYLKCNVLGIDPTAFFIDAGSIPTKALLAALQENNLAALPKELAAATLTAKGAYAKTGDPREIDFLLDRALFADLLSEASDFPFAKELVSARADLTNLLICLRLLRGNSKETTAALFQKSMLPAGSLNEEFFLTGFGEGERALLALVAKTPYAAVANGADKCTLAEIEKRADDYITARLKEVKRMPFGAEIPLAYLYALEGAVKNLRMILAGKKAGLAADALLARVRESYV